MSESKEPAEPAKNTPVRKAEDFWPDHLATEDEGDPAVICPHRVVYSHFPGGDEATVQVSGHSPADLEIVPASSRPGKPVPWAILRVMEPSVNDLLQERPDGTSGWLKVRDEDFNWINGFDPDDPNREPRDILISREAAAKLGDILTRFARHGDVRPPTRVTSVRKMTPEEISKAGIVYVGRANHFAGLAAHPLANPYKLPKAEDSDQIEADRYECVTLYRRWLRGDPERVAMAKALRGRILGCWCGEWNGIGEPGLFCHAVEIARLAEEV